MIVDDIFIWIIVREREKKLWINFKGQWVMSSNITMQMKTSYEEKDLHDKQENRTFINKMVFDTVVGVSQCCWLRCSFAS